MASSCKFFVEGIPKGQPRPRAFALNGKARVFDPGTAEGWKSQVAIAAREVFPQVNFQGPVTIGMLFFMPRPKRLEKKSAPPDPIKHTGKPDIDNLAKAVLDALTQIGAWADDSQVSRMLVGKQYAARAEKSGAFIEVTYEEG